MEEGELGDDTNPVMEVPKGSPSLISALNVEKALRGIGIYDITRECVLNCEWFNWSDELIFSVQQLQILITMAGSDFPLGALMIRSLLLAVCINC